MIGDCGFEAMREHDFTPEVVLGNHDAYPNVRPWCGDGAVEGRLCSSTDEGPWRRITLDSSDNTIGEPQLAYLANELEGARRAALLVHHPVLEIGTPVDRSGAALRDRAALKALLNSLDCAETLFCGHYHMINEIHEANIRQFVTPAVSYQIVKQSERIRVDTTIFGYRLFEFDGTEIRSQVALMSEPR